MGDIFYSISDEIFSLFPEYVRGVILAYEVENTKSSPRLFEMLRAEEASVRDRVNLDILTSHPRIASWREGFRKAVIKPSEFRASIEAMTRCALRHLLPIGSEQVEHPAPGEIIFAEGKTVLTR